MDFFGQYVSEWNPNKDAAGQDFKSFTAETVNETEEHPTALSEKEMLSLLAEDASDKRREYYARMVRTEHLHDFHYPDPVGPPNPSQPCAKLLKGTTNMWYCGNAFPKDLVLDVQGQSVAQDALRPDLWRCHLWRNCPLMNSHMPAVSLGAQSNTDAQPVVTRHQSEMYCGKYITKHHKGMGTRSALYEVMDDMAEKDAVSKAIYGDEGFEAKKLGGKLHKAFMAEVGEEMCQAEVAHHANGSPEYFCNRREKYVHLYKKALGLSTARKKNEQQEEDWEPNADWDNGWLGLGDDSGNAAVRSSGGRRLVTKPSDLELYERRQYYEFADGAGLSAYLPHQATPKEQVLQASLYEFFRTVRFHGGKHPRLSWHEPKDMPIVIMSPVVKLREGPDFAFGARWALMQIHTWTERRRFLDMDDDAVRAYFRTWVQGGESPWYVEELYLQENSRALRKPGQARDAKMKTCVTTAEEHDEGDDDFGQGNGDADSETECSEQGGTAEVDADTKVFKMLYRGDVAQTSRQAEQLRKGGIFNQKHGFYKRTRCTSTAQEQQSALPGGVINVHEDTDDECEYGGEEKEIAKEMQEVRAAQHRVNQSGWDADSKGRGKCPRTGESVELRLDWAEVEKQLSKGTGGDVSEAATVREGDVLQKYPLDDLDPTQRAFVNRVLAWGAADAIATMRSDSPRRALEAASFTFLHILRKARSGVVSRRHFCLQVLSVAVSGKGGRKTRGVATTSKT